MTRRGWRFGSQKNQSVSEKKLPDQLVRLIESNRYRLRVEATITSHANDVIDRQVAQPVNGSVYFVDLETNQEFEIGRIFAFRMVHSDTEAIAEWVRIEGDEHMAPVEWLLEVINIEELFDYGSLLFLAGVVFKREWQGFGLALPALSTFIDLMNVSFTFFAAKPLPVRDVPNWEARYPNRQRALMRLASRMGFQQTDPATPFMVGYREDLIDSFAPDLDPLDELPPEITSEDILAVVLRTLEELPPFNVSPTKAHLQSTENVINLLQALMSQRSDAESRVYLLLGLIDALAVKAYVLIVRQKQQDEGNQVIDDLLARLDDCFALLGVNTTAIPKVKEFSLENYRAQRENERLAMLESHYQSFWMFANQIKTKPIAPQDSTRELYISIRFSVRQMLRFLTTDFNQEKNNAKPMQ